MSEPGSTQPEAPADAEPNLEESIDALLADVTLACDRFENPEEPEAVDPEATEPPDQEPADAAPGRGPSDDLSESEPDDETEAEPDAALQSDAEPSRQPTTDVASEVEEALHSVASNAEDLLGQAADDLLADIEAPITTDAEPTAGGETDTAAASDTSEDHEQPADQTAGGSGGEDTDEEALAAAADNLLDELSFEADTDAQTGPLDAEPEPADPSGNPSESAGKPAGTSDTEADPAPTGSTDGAATDPLDSEAFDALLDGEPPPTPDPPSEPEPDETAAVVSATEPDTEPESAPAPAPADEPAAPPPQQSVPEPQPADNAPVPEPAVSEDPQPETASGGFGQSTPAAAVARWTDPLVERMPDRLRDAWAWCSPRGSAAVRATARVSAPIGAKALLLMSKPLEGRPPKVRDSIGWVALWTAFLALCVWGWLVVQSPETRIPDADASGIASVEEPLASPDR
ncbi:MAG: hypothetical protein AAGA55_00180 [Planctomycetota bacterium]